MKREAGDLGKEAEKAPTWDKSEMATQNGHCAKPIPPNNQVWPQCWIARKVQSVKFMEAGKEEWQDQKQKQKQKTRRQQEIRVHKAGLLGKPLKKLPATTRKQWKWPKMGAKDLKSSP